MSKLVKKEIKKLIKNNTHKLDAYSICKKIDDKLTLKKFVELWKNN
jgi:hypothetical protein